MRPVGSISLTLFLIHCAFALMNVRITKTSMTRHQKKEKSVLSLFQDFENEDSKLNLSKSDMKRLEDLRARYANEYFI